MNSIGKIKIMNDNLSNKIAAGEVVERISSVVKELVENSIDAGSKNITVDLVDAGKKSIKVIDDGSGMNKFDALLCFKRHATSKLYKDDDLYFINTLGFRGEALPSIASVSDVVLKTCDGVEGTCVKIKGGETYEVMSSALKRGTIIEVKNLFYNTPARLKYLKSESSELTNVVYYLEKLCLANPHISFNLTNNSKSLIKTSGKGDLFRTIHEIYGLSVSSNMLRIQISSDDYDIDGYICKPSVLKSNRNHMTLIINGRVIKNNEINKTINEAYHTYKPESLFPIVVLMINTDPTLIDVNIHPTKQDIKFSKISELKDLIFSSIKDALYKSLLVPNINLSSSDNNEVKEKTNYEVQTTSYLLSESLEENQDYTREEKDLSEKILDQSTHNIEENMTINFLETDKNEKIKKLELYTIGIAFGTYIVAENDEGVYLIDQHAAAERINYEKVLKGLLTKDSIDMLVPINIECTASDFLIIKNNLDKLEEIGFKIKIFGINTFRIEAHPTFIKEGLEKKTIEKIFDTLISEEKNFDINRFYDHVAANIACKMSVKGNTRITNKQADYILKELVYCDNPYNCPHGRPTIIKFTIYELEKMFKRKM